LDGFAGAVSRRRGRTCNTIMKTLFTAEAVSKGGRSGTIRSPDGLPDVTLGNPLVKGIEQRGPNPELLFAGAYSACYHGALGNAAKKLGAPVKDSTVRALVSLIEDDQGGYRLAVELHAQLP
jgi:lipoyl-dependent peroxiredoxin